MLRGAEPRFEPGLSPALSTTLGHQLGGLQSHEDITCRFPTSGLIQDPLPCTTSSRLVSPDLNCLFWRVYPAPPPPHCPPLPYLWAEVTWAHTQKPLYCSWESYLMRNFCILLFLLPDSVLNTSLCKLPCYFLVEAKAIFILSFFYVSSL